MNEANIKRFLVQYLTGSGAWLDGCTIDNQIAIFDTEEAAEDFAMRADACTRIVVLTGAV